MTNYCVGCDNIVGGESGLIHKVASVLEKAGNTCEELNVGPNFVQSKGLSASSKGKVAVFIVGGSDIGTYVDFMDGMKSGGYYHYKYIWFAFASWTATTWITCEELKTRALVRAHDDNFSNQSSIAPWLGKSADYFFSKQTNMGYVCGQSPEELANKILGNNGGGDGSNSGNNGGSGGNVKDCVQKLLKHWDGDVECVFRGKNVFINKIRTPEKNYTTALYEGINVFTENTTVTDINPNTPNHLIVEWTGGTIEFKDEKLIFRFGEKLKTMTAVRKVVTYVKDTSSETEGSGESGDGSSSEEGTEETGDGTQQIGEQTYNSNNFV